MTRPTRAELAAELDEVRDALHSAMSELDDANERLSRADFPIYISACQVDRDRLRDVLAENERLWNLLDRITSKDTAP